MPAMFLVSYLFAAVVTHRLVGVVVGSTSADHRRDAIWLIGLVWGGSSLGPGVVLAIGRAQELAAMF
ncbi:hypothetical protein [Actinokineospora globicatena]|uniref:Uncharacterized protein n=1 Tax=Actinokineospora globicatena TaxID=103729 RepID=A0A9W6QPI6_9PSEU|nr:hypothetical protein [Actinokineospora globicatena]GLW92259.1 hypothetical protein Aglo03_30750 [Actinokineospora globicatena]